MKFTEDNDDINPVKLATPFHILSLIRKNNGLTMEQIMNMGYVLVDVPLNELLRNDTVFLHGDVYLPND